MSGEHSSDKPMTAEEKVDSRFNQLQGYLTKKSVPQPESRTIDHYLSMTRSEMGMHSWEDLAEIQWEVDAYAYYLQDLINQHEVKKDIAQRNIDRLVGGRLDEYKIFGTREKWLAAIQDNDAAMKYDAIVHSNELVIKRLAFLSKRLERISTTIENLQRTKRRSYGKD